MNSTVYFIYTHTHRTQLLETDFSDGGTAQEALVVYKKLLNLTKQIKCKVNSCLTQVSVQKKTSVIHNICNVLALFTHTQQGKLAEKQWTSSYSQHPMFICSGQRKPDGNAGAAGIHTWQPSSRRVRKTESSGNWEQHTVLPEYQPLQKVFDTKNTSASDLLCLRQYCEQLHGGPQGLRKIKMLYLYL